MEFINLPNKGKISPLCCEDNPNCGTCIDSGCNDCQCGCVPMIARPCI